MITKTVNVDASDLDGCMDNGEYPEKIAEIIEGELERMRQEPGAAENATIQIVIVNDFEPEEDDESEDDETETKE